MNVHTARPLLAGVSLAGSLAIVAACSGTSPSMNPTSPTALSTASAGANFSPNPGTPSCGPTAGSCQGRFTGGGFQFTANDVRVSRGFTIHCDNILTNNLEVNWAGGNNFHIDKESLDASSVGCSKPVEPNPPDAGVSRIEATSPGTCNGEPATINFILEDHGEPGTSDQAYLHIVGSAAGCDLTVGLSTIDGGNIQAHFDQPHK